MSDEAARGVKIQITLKPEVADRFDVIGRDLGLVRSATVAFLVSRYWQEYYTPPGGREG